MEITAAYYKTTGEAEKVLQIGSFELEEPAENEVQINIIISGINPSDVKIRSGSRGKLSFPYIIPHSDGAGVVRRIGKNVTNFKIKDRVWIYNAAWNRFQGTACIRVNIDSSLAISLHNNTPFETGACLGIPGLTSCCMFIIFKLQSGRYNFNNRWGRSSWNICNTACKNARFQSYYNSQFYRKS